MLPTADEAELSMPVSAEVQEPAAPHTLAKYRELPTGASTSSGVAWFLRKGVTHAKTTCSRCTRTRPKLFIET
jgi:hypothetical protein